MTLITSLDNKKKNEERLKFINEIEQYRNSKYVGAIVPDTINLSKFPIDEPEDAEIYGFEDIINKNRYLFRWRFKISGDVTKPTTLIFSQIV
jgi:hypothetical protein